MKDIIRTPETHPLTWRLHASMSACMSISALSACKSSTVAMPRFTSVNVTLPASIGRHIHSSAVKVSDRSPGVFTPSSRRR